MEENMHTSLLDTLFSDECSIAAFEHLAGQSETDAQKRVEDQRTWAESKNICAMLDDLGLAEYLEICIGSGSGFCWTNDAAPNTSTRNMKRRPSWMVDCERQTILALPFGNKWKHAEGKGTKAAPVLVQ